MNERHADLKPDIFPESTQSPHEPADFFAGEAASEEVLFAVGAPFFDHLVSAEGVVPDRFGHVASEGVRV